MNRKKLILSSLDHIDKNMIHDTEFIGPCCLINDDDSEALISKLDQCSIFDNHKRLKEESDYVIDYSNRLMILISEKLNKIHGTEFSVKYWSIILMPWLISSIQLFYERFRRLEKKLKVENDFIVTAVNINSFPQINSTIDAINLFEYQEINHYIYSNYIQCIEAKNIKISDTKTYDLSNSDLYKYSKHSRGDYLKREIWRRIQRNISLILSRSSGYYIDGVYGLSLLDNILITSKTKNKKTNDFLHYEALSQINDLNKSNMETNLSIKDLSNGSVERNNFERITNKLICNFFPQTVLNDFKKNLQNSGKFIKKTNGRMHSLVIGPLIGGYEPMKFISAIFTEFGGKLNISQHGSNYGFLESFPKMAAIEYQACDRFITWGWEKHSNYELDTKILPSPIMSKIRSQGQSKDAKIITLISNLIPLQGNNLASVPEPNHAYGYRSDKVKYLKKINEEYLSSVRYKPYMPDHRGLPDKKFFSEKFPMIQIIEKDLMSQMRQSRLVVIDHPGTSMLEAFSMNVPVIIFMNPKHWGISKDTEIFFDDLISSEILHLSPESAATHTNKIWSDGRNWWHQKKVQDARMKFCDKFAKSNDRWRNEWVNFLNDYD